MAREGDSTAQERMPGASPTGSGYCVLDPEGRDEGVASVAALYVPGPATADVDGAPPLADPAPAQISLVRLFLRVPRPLADLLPDSPGRAALILLGAAAATAAEVLWIPPRVYGPAIQVGHGFLVGVAGPLVALFLRSPGRAAWLLVRAATITAADLVELSLRACQTPLRITEGFLLRIGRSMAVLLPASPGRAAMMVLVAAAATAAEVLWIPPHVYGPAIQVGYGFLVGVAGPLVALFLRSPGRAAWLLVRAALITAADLVGLSLRACQAPLRIARGFSLRLWSLLDGLLPASPGRATLTLLVAVLLLVRAAAITTADLVGPRLRACQAPLRILRLWNLLPDTPGRAALMLLCAAAATAAEVVGIPRLVYGVSIQVTFVLLIAAARPLVSLRRRSPGHAALPLLRAAASAAADLVGLPPRAFAALRMALLRAPGLEAVLVVVATVAVLVAAAASLSRRGGGASPSRTG